MRNQAEEKLAHRMGQMREGVTKLEEVKKNGLFSGGTRGTLHEQETPPRIQSPRADQAFQPQFNYLANHTNTNERLTNVAGNGHDMGGNHGAGENHVAGGGHAAGRGHVVNIPIHEVLNEAELEAKWAELYGNAVNVVDEGQLIKKKEEEMMKKSGRFKNAYEQLNGVAVHLLEHLEKYGNAEDLRRYLRDCIIKVFPHMSTITEGRVLFRTGLKNMEKSGRAWVKEELGKYFKSCRLIGPWIVKNSIFDDEMVKRAGYKLVEIGPRQGYIVKNGRRMDAFQALLEIKMLKEKDRNEMIVDLVNKQWDTKISKM